MTSERMAVLAELACVAVIVVGVAAMYWPLALIVGGTLTLLGLQGVGRAGTDDRMAE